MNIDNLNKLLNYIDTMIDTPWSAHTKTIWSSRCYGNMILDIERLPIPYSGITPGLIMDFLDIKLSQAEKLFYLSNHEVYGFYSMTLEQQKSCVKQLLMDLVEPRTKLETSSSMTANTPTPTMEEAHVHGHHVSWQSEVDEAGQGAGKVLEDA